jgi:hypothetical protein
VTKRVLVANLVVLVVAICLALYANVGYAEPQRGRALFGIGEVRPVVDRLCIDGCGLIPSNGTWVICNAKHECVQIHFSEGKPL